MRADNSHHIITAARRRATATRRRAVAALRRMDNTGQPISFDALAREAGVSRSWLYAQTELRDQLRRLTAIAETAESAPTRTERRSDASLRQRLTLAHERIRELQDENRQLCNQIALLHGQLRANRIAGPHVTDSVHKANTELTPQNNRARPK